MTLFDENAKPRPLVADFLWPTGPDTEFHNAHRLGLRQVRAAERWLARMARYTKRSQREFVRGNSKLAMTYAGEATLAYKHHQKHLRLAEALLRRMARWQ